MEDVDVLIVDGKLSSIQPLIPLLEVVAKERRRLVIIAENVDGDALSTLILNKLRGLQVRLQKKFNLEQYSNNNLNNVSLLKIFSIGCCCESTRLWRQSQNEFARFGKIKIVEFVFVFPCVEK